MFQPKLCTYCGVEPVETYHGVYCSFCYHRFQKLGWAYRRAGRKMPSIRRIHRTWNYWRRTPELDAMYLDPIERAA